MALWLFPLYRWGNWDLSNWPRVTSLWTREISDSMALQHEKMGKWGPWKGRLLPEVSKWVTDSSEKRRRASRILLQSRKYQKNKPTTGFPGGSDGKVSTCNMGGPSSIARSGRPPGAENGNPLQYSWLENLMDRGSWWLQFMGSWSWTRLSNYQSQRGCKKKKTLRCTVHEM